jgi:hypothetical protein
MLDFVHTERAPGLPIFQAQQLVRSFALVILLAALFIEASSVRAQKKNGKQPKKPAATSASSPTEAAQVQALDAIFKRADSLASLRHVTSEKNYAPRFVGAASVGLRPDAHALLLDLQAFVAGPSTYRAGAGLGIAFVSNGDMRAVETSVAVGVSHWLNLAGSKRVPYVTALFPAVAFSRYGQTLYGELGVAVWAVNNRLALRASVNTKSIASVGMQLLAWPGAGDD